jgi:hypothetical protein
MEFESLMQTLVLHVKGTSDSAPLVQTISHLNPEGLVGQREFVIS